MRVVTWSKAGFVLCAVVSWGNVTGRLHDSLRPVSGRAEEDSRSAAPGDGWTVWPMLAPCACTVRDAVCVECAAVGTGSGGEMGSYGIHQERYVSSRTIRRRRVEQAAALYFGF